MQHKCCSTELLPQPTSLKCKVGMVASFHNPSTLETEAGRSGVVGYTVLRLSEKTKTDSVNECFCVTMKFF